MASSDVKARKTTEAQLIDRAMRDPALRAELVANPKAVFARELGLTVPDQIDVQVLEESPSTVYLVLPPASPGAGVELTDAELEGVSGGWSEDSGACASCPTCQTCNTCDATSCP